MAMCSMEASLYGHVFHGSKPLPVGMHLKKGCVARALEIKEQTAKRRKSDREHVIETRAETEGPPSLPIDPLFLTF